MRIKVTYESLNEKIFLPIHYNFYIQSLIYKTLSPLLAKKIHDEGYKFEKRGFKLFTFSRILEKGEKVKREGKDYLLFKNGISFIYSSPIVDIIADFGERGLREREFNLCGQRVFISKIEVITTPRIDSSVLIKFLSPVTIHSTVKKMDGVERSIYYKPVDKEFKELITNNLKKKYFLVYEKNVDDLDIEIKPIKFSIKKNLHIIIYKDTPIEAYDGIFELSGSKELIYLSYDTGLGDRNSEGFGLWEIWKGGDYA
ncbi:MAG: CRISPR-associated endoribonuclease Cas6 [Caldisericia bacterium]